MTRTVCWWACILAVVALAGCTSTDRALQASYNAPLATPAPPPPADPDDWTRHAVPGARDLISLCDHGNRIYQSPDGNDQRPVVIPRDLTCLNANGDAPR